VVAHAKCENPLVDAEPGGKEHKVGRLLVDRLQRNQQFSINYQECLWK
jgi:hypothetical protein